MLRCLELAKNGIGRVSPNPLVGSVIVHKGKIIGEGWHREYGRSHAEVNAIASVKQHERLRESTLYVNLEPCNFFGKTPPCSDLIIEKGIERVVIGCVDPNPKVAGGGIQRLKDAGVKVSSGVLEKESLYLNRSFFKQIKTGVPYIVLKWAQSPDGFIAGKNGTRVRITNSFSDTIVHKLRSEMDGILVGGNTIRNDNPQLTTRHWTGSDPKVIVLSGSGSLPRSAMIFDRNPEVLLSKTRNENAGFKSSIAIGDIGLKEGMKELSDLGIQNVLVEGGAQTLQSFLAEGLWDECWVFEGNEKLNDGIKAPDLPNGPKIQRNVRNNQLFIIVNSSSN